MYGGRAGLVYEVGICVLLLRVPSPSNIADDPSRKNCSFLKSLKCQEDKINMDEILASLAL